MARPLQGAAERLWCGDVGRPVPAERINAFPTGPVAAVDVHPTNRPRLHPQIWEYPDQRAAPRRGRGHARPVPHLQIWERPDSCTRPVGNTFMCSETYRFAPEPGVFHKPLLPGRAWPVPYLVRRNHSGAFNADGPVLAERINASPTWSGGTIPVRLMWAGLYA